MSEKQSVQENIEKLNYVLEDDTRQDHEKFVFGEVSQLLENSVEAFSDEVDETYASAVNFLHNLQFTTLVEDENKENSQHQNSPNS